MRIQEILIESHQLDEGPLLNKIGSAVGKGVGTLAKGVGAVAGGIAGLGAAAKKGFQAGKTTVGGAGDADPAAAAGGAAPAGKPGAAAGGGTSTQPKGFIAGVKAGQNQGLSAINDPNVIGSSSSGAGAAAGEEDPAADGAAAPAKPAAAGAAGAAAAPATTPPSTTDINKAGPKGTAQAKPIQGTVAKQAAAKTGAALAGQDQAQAGQTMYSQVKANIDKLDKKGKQRILQLLQKSMAAPAAGGAAPAAGGAAPAAGGAAPAKPAAGGAMGAMAGQLAKGGAAPNTMANAPVSKTNTAKPGNPNAAPSAGAAPAAEPAAAPSGEKTIANPVATVGTKRASNIGQPTFDTQTGKSLPGQALNNVRKKAEYGSGALGGIRKKIKAGAAQPEMAGKINTGSMVLEGFSLFRKK